MTNLRLQLLRVADAYAQARGLSRSRISTVVLNGGRVLDGIANGRDLTTATFERSMAWFSDNWPETAAWPDGVSRPVVSNGARNAAARKK
jgi:hypothetical protein